MNPKMWGPPRRPPQPRHPCPANGIAFIGPNRGRNGRVASEGERGAHGLTLEIVAAIEALLDGAPKPLAGKKVVVTSGPTHEAD